MGRRRHFDVVIVSGVYRRVVVVVVRELSEALSASLSRTTRWRPNKSQETHSVLLLRLPSADWIASRRRIS